MYIFKFYMKNKLFNIGLQQTKMDHCDWENNHNMIDNPLELCKWLLLNIIFNIMF